MSDLSSSFGDSTFDDAFDASDFSEEPGVRSTVFITDVVDAFEDAGIPYVTLNGWKTRGRSSGQGFRAAPRGIIVHHTASQTSLDNDVNYMTYNAQYSPIANLYIGRGGEVVVMAAGGCNHAGSGSGTSWGSSVPENSANSYAIGIECGNNGVGEYWPQAQRERLIQVCAVLMDRYAIPINELRAHFEWAPWRKIDPAGPPAPYFQLPNDSSRRWNMDSFRHAVTIYDPHTEEYVKTNEFAVLTAPQRLVDSRDFGLEDGRVGSDLPGDRDSITITIPNWTDEVAVEVTITLVDPRRYGFATAWNGVGNPPTASSCNTQAGIAAIANTTTVALNGDTFEIFVKGDSHIVVDLVGVYFNR